MSLIKFSERLPLSTSVFNNFLNADDFFNDDYFAQESLMPAMNVKENQDDFEVELAVPGFAKEDFEVTIDNNRLQISADKRVDKKEKKEGYLRKEFNYSSFKRSLKLPESVNLDKKVKANYKDGILKMNLLKKEDTKVLPKKVIEIS